MFKLSSPIVKNGRIEKRFGNLGDRENIVFGIPQISFPLCWEGAPENTNSFAIVFIDYDNAEDEGYPFIHWLVSDIPAHINEIAENASRGENFYIQGHNSWSISFGPYEAIPEEYALYFGGPAPEREHEYEIQIYALDYSPGLKNGFWYNDLRKAMQGHILAETVLTGLYG